MRQDLPPELQGGLSSELLEARKERWSRIQKSSSYDPDWLNPSKLQKSMQWLEFGSPLRDALVSAASIIHKDPLHRSRFHYFRDLFQSEDQLKQHPIAAWPLYEGEPLLSLLYPLMFLSLVGDIQQFNDSKGIAEKITKETLQDLLVWLEHHYNQKGYYTLHQASNWIRHHFVGRIFRLGRLQFLMDQFSLPAQIFRRKNENPLFVWNDGRTYSLQKGKTRKELWGKLW
ncbi:MAG: acyltransferase domain-containing protein, partial [Verrucomicrobiota bacterium]